MPLKSKHTENIDFDINSLPTPCYVVCEELLRKNLLKLQDIEKRTGCKILLAQKAFSMYRAYPLISQFLSGTTASGLYEARLGKEEFSGEVHVFSPAYNPNEFDELLYYADHFVFNSLHQLAKFRDKIPAEKACGIRINPEFSTQADHAIYDPCSPNSRLGTTLKNFEQELSVYGLDKVDGLHFHTLCEQNSDALKSTVLEVDKKFGKYLSKMKWINFGGGHHITKVDYDVETLIWCIEYFQKKYNLTVYIEPGEAVALNAGFLVTTVLDTFKNGMNIAILDASAACHMPDVLEMPYRPNIIGAAESDVLPHTYRLGANTCLAGDVIGDYSFENALCEGDKLVLCDMAIYSMCKNNTFNGMPLPSIWLNSKINGLQQIKAFVYEDFKSRV